MNNLHRLEQAFVNVLCEDLVLSWQERNETLNFSALLVTDVQRGSIKELIQAILLRLPHDQLVECIDNQDEKGGDLYIGLMYDSYDTPLSYCDELDYHGDLTAFNDPFNDNQLLFEGYIEFGDQHYTL